MHNQFVFLTLNNHEIFFGQRRKNRIVILKTRGSAPACYGELSGFESKYIVKTQNGRHKQKSGQHTLASQKIYNKNNF